jgi:uncharacterized membrane protein YhhN
VIRPSGPRGPDGPLAPQAGPARGDVANVADVADVGDAPTGGPDPAAGLRSDAAAGPDPAGDAAPGPDPAGDPRPGAPGPWRGRAAAGEAAPAFVCAFVALLALHLVATADGWDVVRLATKPLLMPVLAGWVRAWRGPRTLVAALLCGWGGDVLLEIGGTGAFLAGMGCFAAGHVCYLRIFVRRGAFAGPRRAVRLRCGAYAAVWAVTVALLWPGLDAGMRVPVAVYSLLLASMAAGAYGLGAVTAVGGALFLLSDSLIATGLAGWPRPPGYDVWIMLSYVLAQSLLAGGVLAGLLSRTGGRTATPRG